MKAKRSITNSFDQFMMKRKGRDSTAGLNGSPVLTKKVSIIKSAKIRGLKNIVKRQHLDWNFLN